MSRLCYSCRIGLYIFIRVNARLFILKARYSSITGQLSGGQNEIILTKQTKICLDFFIKNEGKVVTKDDIFQECWGNRGIIVSDSTLRQSLYKLRKAFNDIGLEQEVLVNHSRNKYYLVAGIIETVSDAEVITENSAADSEQCALSDNDTVISSKTNVPVRGWPVSFKKTCAVMIACVILLLCGILLRSAVFKKTIIYFPYATVHGRHYYFTHGFTTDKSQAIWRAGYWLDYQMVTVNASRFVYINSARQNLMSIMICDDKIEDVKSECQSFVVIGGKEK